MEREKKFKELSMFLTPEGAEKILLRLDDFFGTKKELAEKIGCSYPTVKKWTRGNTPGKKYLPDILSLAFEHVPSTKKIVAREVFRMRDLGKELGVLKEFKSSTSQFLSEMDKESIKILRYVGKHRFAHINELANYLSGSSHSEILTRIEEVINARSENFFGEPAMEFRKSALDSRTGETVTFSWWLTRTGLEILNPGSKKDRVEVFEDGKKISFIYSSERRNSFQPDAKAEFNHGILSVQISETNSKEGQ
jgi:transcriptional regulator with XRE-family HTH domain